MRRRPPRLQELRFEISARVRGVTPDRLRAAAIGAFAAWRFGRGWLPRSLRIALFERFCQGRVERALSGGHGE